MGSDSDLGTMAEAARTLERFGVAYEMHIASAHRVPDTVAGMADRAASEGVEVFIAGAGAAAHLAGMIAAHTTLPVIGVPLAGSALGGVDALYATVQMPAGVPVATVAVNGAANAAVLAVQILAGRRPELRQKLLEHKAGLARAVADKDARLQELGWEAYLKERSES